MKLFYLAAFIVCGLAHAAPPFLPTRDVTVDYAVDISGQTPQSVNVAFEAADQRARIDLISSGVFILADLPAGRAQMVVPALHALVKAPDISALTLVLAQAGEARFTPLRAGRYAGRDCETYLVLDPHNGTGTACLTPDGVILHFSGHNERGAIEATAQSVDFADAQSALFLPPDGFARLDLPPGAVAALLRGGG